jgi:hypothetical protein
MYFKLTYLKTIQKCDQKQRKTAVKKMMPKKLDGGKKIANFQGVFDLVPPSIDAP